MQKLKRPELSKRLGSLLGNLLSPVKQLTGRLAHFPRYLTILVCLGLCLLVLSMLSGCSPRTVRPELPAQADPRPLPEFKGKTYRDALIHIPELREAFMACEADKAAIRKALSDD